LVNKWVAVIFVFISIVLVLIVGVVFVSWFSEQVSENLKGYSARLEDDRFPIELKELSKVNTNTVREWQFFSDFSSYAKQKNVTQIYFDHSTNCLYYLTPISPVHINLETNIFYYDKVF